MSKNYKKPLLTLPNKPVTPQVTPEVTPPKRELTTIELQTLAEIEAGREALKRHKPDPAIENDFSGQVRGNSTPPNNVLVQQDTMYVPPFTTPGTLYEG